MNHRLSSLAIVLLAAACNACAQIPSSPILSTQDAVARADGQVRVGRLTLVQGDVRVHADAEVEGSAAAVNWPVGAPNIVVTGAASRAEMRVGSTAIRLDADSMLEVLALADGQLHLRLVGGSASVRVVNPEVVPEFVFETDQAQVTLEQPGLLRIDAQRVPGTTSISVLEGQAVVHGGGASLTVRAGRSAVVDEQDVRTLQAQRDAFDEWALARERDEAASQARLIVGTEMTGYEDLDRHGSWQVDAEYGHLWLPNVAPGWSPYSDGRWSWVAPWGWTWIDNAPWGYAPFHYGSWVQVHQRWAWAPGRLERRPRFTAAPLAPGVRRPFGTPPRMRPRTQPLRPPPPRHPPPRLAPARPRPEPGRAQPIRTEPVLPQPGRPGRDEAGRPQPVRPQHERPHPGRAWRDEPGRAQPIRTEPRRAEPVVPEPVRPQPVRPQHERPQPGQGWRDEPGRAQPIRTEPRRPPREDAGGPLRSREERPAPPPRSAPAPQRPEPAAPAPQRPPQAAPAPRPGRERGESRRAETDSQGVHRVER